MILEDASNAEADKWHLLHLQSRKRKLIKVRCDTCGLERVIRKDAYHPLCNPCARKGGKRSNEAKAKMSAAHKNKKNPHEGVKRTEETKALISLATSGENNPNFGKRGEETSRWLGGISFAPYCDKFNEEYKDYIRDFFGNVCFLCDISVEENGQALSVHHKDYNKQCGCDGSKCFCVPLCQSCHSKTNGDRDFWQALITEMLQPAEAWE